MMMMIMRQDKTIDEDTITENNKMVDNELMKMMGVQLKGQIIQELAIQGS